MQCVLAAHPCRGTDRRHNAMAHVLQPLALPPFAAPTRGRDGRWCKQRWRRLWADARHADAMVLRRWERVAANVAAAVLCSLTLGGIVHRQVAAEARGPDDQGLFLRVMSPAGRLCSASPSIPAARRSSRRGRPSGARVPGMILKTEYRLAAHCARTPVAVCGRMRRCSD